MKLVYFNYLWDLYGAALGSTIKAIRLMEAIEAEGHQVKVYWRNAAPQGDGWAGGISLRERAKRRLARILHEPHQLVKNFRYLREERRILQEESPDILISRLDKYVATAPRLKREFNLPLVIEADAPVAYEFRQFHREYLKSPWVLEWCEGYTLRAADAVVTVSHEIASYLARYDFPRERLFVVPNAADVRRFNPSVSGDMVRQKYGLVNRMVIGFIGSFHYWHGVDTLNWLVETICHDFPETAFLLVGAGGPMAEQLKRKVDRAGLTDRVVLPGSVSHDQVPEYVAAMDIVLAPYPPMEYFYYSPVKIYEYMASGKPVVTSELGQIKELIKHGENGFLCSPGDLEGYRRTIGELVRDPRLREQVGRAAYETIAGGHTWSHRAKAWVQILEDVMSDARDI